MEIKFQAPHRSNVRLGGAVLVKCQREAPCLEAPEAAQERGSLRPRAVEVEGPRDRRVVAEREAVEQERWRLDGHAAQGPEVHGRRVGAGDVSGGVYHAD